MDVTLNIPALFPEFMEPDTHEWAHLEIPSLCNILSRARLEQAIAEPYAHWLYRQFGGVLSDHPIPVACLSAGLDGLPGDEGDWMRADPVYLYPDTHSLVLQDPAQLDIQPAEIERIRDVILPLLDDYGVVLHTPHPMRWYLQFRQAGPELTCTPPDDALMKPVNKYLPAGRDSRRWHTLFNEIQMVLATLDVNQQRQERRQLPVNSVWFWGNGSYPSLQPCEYDSCIGEGVLLSSLCLATHSRFQAIDDEWRISYTRKKFLVVYEQLLKAKNLNDPGQWLTALERAERIIFQPLYAALKAGKIKSLKILTDTDRQYHCTSGGLRKFWRPVRKATDLWT